MPVMKRWIRALAVGALVITPAFAACGTPAHAHQRIDPRCWGPVPMSPSGPSGGRSSAGGGVVVASNGGAGGSSDGGSSDGGPVDDGSNDGTSQGLPPPYGPDPSSPD